MRNIRLILSLLCLTLCIGLANKVYAQDLSPEPPLERELRGGQDNDRIQSIRIAFFTDLLQLSPEQASKFWPIFNAYSKEKQDLAERWVRITKEVRNHPNMGDKEAEKYLVQAKQIKVDQNKLEERYTSKFTFLSKTQQLKLQLSESNFRRFLWKHVKRAPRRPGGGKRLRKGMK